MFILGSLESTWWISYWCELNFFRYVLRLSRYERKEIENRRFRSNAVSLILKGSPPPVIFARLVRPLNALQLCRWQFSHKETL